MAVAVLLRGSNSSKAPISTIATAPWWPKIDGKVTRTNGSWLRGLPEGAVFSADSRYLYIGNYIDQDISILRVEAINWSTPASQSAAWSAGGDAGKDDALTSR
jgi:hypothetical protein